jgi:Flp pilus assembly protein TadG
MRVFLTLLNRFRTDTRGVFAVIFALMAIVLVAFAGAVVDFTTVQQARTRSQVALDAAALALQPKINDTAVTTEQIRLLAEGLLIQNIGDARIVASVTSATKDVANGTLNLRATIKVATPFVSLIGIKQLDAALQSEATRKKLNIELTMVLDNSGSMLQQSRMTYLKQAAKCAVNILLHDAPDTNCDQPSSLPKIPNTYISVVPFTQAVNVGSGNSTQAWIDQTGISAIANDNFDNDDNDATPFTGAVNRLALYSGLRSHAWKGCVEARPHTATTAGLHLDTDDTPPTSATPNTLYVPLFAPSNPDTYGNDFVPQQGGTCTRRKASWVWTQTKTRCSNAGNNASNYNKSCGSGTVTTNTYVLTNELGVVSNPSTAPATVYFNGQTSSVDEYTFVSTGSNQYTNTFKRTIEYDFSPREYQERLCKYANATVSYTDGDTGPNVDCPAQAIQPLTDNSSTLLTKIGNMVAKGGTNIHEGAIWGWRVLSPTAPFSEGGAYTGANSKVMILMTDGENTTYYNSGNKNTTLNGSDFYSSNGYPYNSNPNNFRLGWMNANNTQLEDEMDARTVASCNGAKAMGIVVYTIGLSSPEDRKDTLLACASDSGKAYFPTSPAELNAIFRKIAKELSQLRLSK